MARPLDALRDTQREWMINRSRLIASLIGIFALLLILIYRYYSLQITQHDDFLTQSDRNRIRVEVIPRREGKSSTAKVVCWRLINPHLWWVLFRSAAKTSRP